MLYKEIARDIVILIMAVGFAVVNICFVGRSTDVWLNILNLVAFVMCAIGAVYFARRVIKEGEQLDEMTDSILNALSSMSDDVSELNDMLPSDEDIHRISMN